MIDPAAEIVDEAEMAKRLMEVNGRYVIVAHLRPDGDAIGSALGLCGALRKSGRRAICLDLAPISTIRYGYLEGLDYIIPISEYSKEDGDTLVILDLGDPKRLRGSVLPLVGTMPMLCIDHHDTSCGFPGPFLLRPDAGSTSEVVYRVAKLAGLTIERAEAEALWTGIITDTGRFTYDCTSPATLAIASELLALGVRSSMIGDMVFNTERLQALRLKSTLIKSIELRAGGHAALGFLSAEDYATEDCTSVDTDNFVDVVRSVAGVELAVFVRKASTTDCIHISARSRPPYSAAEFCARWGGGGHNLAAGATMDTSLAEALVAIRSAIDDTFNKPNK